MAAGATAAPFRRQYVEIEAPCHTAEVYPDASDGSSTREDAPKRVAMGVEQ